MTTYPPASDPPEPERPKDDGGYWSPNAEGSPGQEPFAGNTDGAPSGEPRPPTPPSDPSGAPAPDPNLPPAPPPPGPAGIPPAPPPPGAGYTPYAGGGAVPPPPPPPPAYNAEGAIGGQPRNGLGKAALVCGIIAVALSFVPGVNWFVWPLGVLAIVFGAIGWSRANKGQATNKKFAIAGLVLGIVSFFTFCLIWIVIFGGASTSMYNTAPM